MSKNDHTAEVEKRVTAIPIDSNDSCGFFKVRELALAPCKECFFCVYGKFEEKKESGKQTGFCKFKK